MKFQHFDTRINVDVSFNKTNGIRGVQVVKVGMILVLNVFNYRYQTIIYSVRLKCVSANIITWAVDLARLKALEHLEF